MYLEFSPLIESYPNAKCKLISCLASLFITIDDGNQGLLHGRTRFNPSVTFVSAFSYIIHFEQCLSFHILQILFYICSLHFLYFNAS